MALIGVITCDPNPPGVDLDRWRRIVVENSQLRREPPRDVINPFTGKPAAHIPLDTDGQICIDGSVVGAIGISLSGEGDLDVWSGDDDRVKVESIARAVAVELGGIYTPLP